ncbi:MAG: hypothetical protein WD872_03260 [Pirellulaceae bacterium]
MTARAARFFVPGRFGCVLLLICGALVCAASAGGIANDADSADDGWRRTAHGWERAPEWIVEASGGALRPGERFITDELTRPRSARWDFHPAALAVLQLVAIAVGFALCSEPTVASKPSSAFNGEHASRNAGGHEREAA